MRRVEGRARGAAAATLFATAAAVALVGPARGQTTAAAQAADNGAVVGELIVTANRRAEALSKAPLAISALSQDQLTKSGVVGLEDLTSAVPAVEIKTISLANSIQVTVRGITNSDFNPGASPAVATYFDGVYVARTQGLNGALYDVDRVEVLRGPQGTLYGRNATGGNLNVVTAGPGASFAAAAQAGYGNFNDVQTRGMVNVPLSDTFAVRAAFATHRSDGAFATQGTTSRDLGAADDFSGRLTALWTPNADLKWRLTLEDSISRGTPGLDLILGPDGKPVDGKGIFKRPVPGTLDPSKYIRNFSVRSRVDWSLGNNFSLAYLAGYQNLKFQADFLAAGEAAPVADGDRTGASESYSHEVDLSYEGARLKNILGGSYFHENERDLDGYHFYQLGVSFRGGTSQGPTATDEAWGVFDQATYTVADGLRAVAGVRYSDEKKGNALNNFGQEFCAVTTPLNTLLGPLMAACPFAPQGAAHGEWSNTDWKAGAEWDVTPDVLSYLTVTTGFKAGGLNIGAGVITPQSYTPEKVTSYEAGLKGSFFDHRARLYADVFDMQYRDIQVTQLSGLNNVTENAARASIYGVELEGQWQITPNGRLSGFLDFSHATYGEYRNAVDQQTGIVYPSLNGRHLPNAPDFSGRLAYEHRFDLPGGGALTPAASVYYQTKIYLREFNLPIDTVDGYSKTKLDLEWVDPSRRWNVDAYVDNLENKAVRNGGFTVIGLYISDYNPPRTYGLRVGYKY